MVLDLIVDTSRKNDDQDGEAQPAQNKDHQDFASETGSESKMAVGTSAGINSEDLKRSAMGTVCGTVCSLAPPTLEIAAVARVTLIQQKGLPLQCHQVAMGLFSIYWTNYYQW